MSLKTIQDRALNNFADQNPNQAFDPTMIIVIYELIMEFLEMFTGSWWCGQSPEDAADIVQHPTRMQRRLINIKVRRALGRRAYKQHGKDVLVSLLKTGKTGTVAEMKEAYENLKDE